MGVSNIIYSIIGKNKEHDWEDKNEIEAWMSQKIVIALPRWGQALLSMER
jgi:hypothetical protein